MSSTEDANAAPLGAEQRKDQEEQGQGQGQEAGSAPAEEAHHDITIAPSEHHEHKEEKQDNRPRDSKGWDGKLRLPRKSENGASPEGDEDTEDESEGEGEGGEANNADGAGESEDGGKGKVRVEREEGPPPEELEADEDLLEGVESDEEDLDLVHCKIQRIGALGLERMKKLKVCLRNAAFACATGARMQRT
jgi:protein phosphatase 1 regulatory subunit 7